MSSNLDASQVDEGFCCPVCRAKQLLSSQCRRCQADLALAVRVRQRLKFLKSLPPSASVEAEIRWLAPRHR